MQNSFTLQGVDVNEDKIRIYADVIQDRLGLNCSALSGANIADEGMRASPFRNAFKTSFDLYSILSSCERSIL